MKKNGMRQRIMKRALSAKNLDQKESRENEAERGPLQRKVETMPDGRYIIYYSWDEEEAGS